MKEIASYGLALIGFGVVAAALAASFSSSLEYPAARYMMINLLRTDPNRAEAICRSVKGTFFEALAAAMKIAVQVGTRDLQMLSAATRPTYDATGAAISLAAKQLLGKAKLGTIAALGGLALAISTGILPAVHIIFGLLAVIGFVWLFARKVELDRTIILARADVLPEVDRAFADGRYVMPAPRG